MATPRKRTTTATKVEPTVVIDDTVKNQESLGSAEVVDRNPAPVDIEAEKEAARKARLLQTEAVLKPESARIDSPDKFSVRFLQSGFTVSGRVWKAGQILELNEESRPEHEDLNGNVWYDLSEDNQVDRYGKVIFVKE